MATTVWFLLDQLRWLLHQFFVLATFMGLGVKWFTMFVRTMCFGISLATAFLPMLWYYIRSPYILRHIRYSTAEVPQTPIDVAAARRMANAPDTSEASGTDEEASPFTPDRKLPNNRTFLDIHFPLPVQDLMYSKKGPSFRCGPSAAVNVGLEPGCAVPSSSCGFPVVVCFTGGAWMIGVHYWMAFFARVMSACGFVVVTPDYRNFPAASVPAMVEDVSAAVSWTLQHIEGFHGDPERVYLLGQSAGAHLLTLSLLDQVDRLGATELSVKPRPMNLARRGEPPCIPTDPAQHYDPRQVQGVLTVSGVYNMVAMERYMHSRGLYRTVLRSICAGDLTRCSAYHRVKAAHPTALFKYMPRRIVALHGDCDVSAPLSESEHLVAALQKQMNAGAAQLRKDCPGDDTADHVIELRVMRGATHTTPIVEDMLTGSSPLVGAVVALHREVSLSPDSTATALGEMDSWAAVDGVADLACPPAVFLPVVHSRQARIAGWISAF